MNKTKAILVAVVSLLCTTAGFSQLPPPPPPPPCWPPPCNVPVNNGVIFLIAGGLLLGSFAFYKAWKKSLQ
jgi:hypothetical protein